jgi:YQGE family putative transporter
LNPAKTGTARLHPKAWLVIALYALYATAESLCSVFVGVYFYINSLDFRVVCYHYLALYIVTPFVFTLAGWYAKTRDRTRVYRTGLALHAVYYAALLWLREDSARHPVALGVLLGITWGFFWVGTNTFQYDFSLDGHGEYYIGLITSMSGAARMLGPLVSGLIIGLAPVRQWGYQTVFALALLIYLAAIALSLRIPHDTSPRPFHLRPALFPPKAHGDWRRILAASFTLAGSSHIFDFVLALFMLLQTGSEINVGGFVSWQALVAVTTAYLAGRWITPRTRSRAMRAGTALLLLAGLAIALRFDWWMLILFGFLRSMSEPLFGIPHTGIRFDVMRRTAPAGDRIEYLCAWEWPLLFGRLFTMGMVIALYTLFNVEGLRAAIILVSGYRIATYLCLRGISFVREPGLPGPQPAPDQCAGGPDAPPATTTPMAARSSSAE